jgi:hypothetical protein
MTTLTIDNFNLILDQISFNNKNEFYFLQIIQRKKDGNTDLHVRNGYRLIRSYYIYSKEELINLKDRIIELCKNNNARAYINLNIRNAKEVALECIRKYADLVLNDNSFMGNNIWDSSCGCVRARGYKSLWIIDVDNPDKLEEIKKIVNSCTGSTERIKCIIPTVHGYHIISYGFNRSEFQNKLKENNLDFVDIHKDNPTLLYYDS